MSLGFTITLNLRLSGGAVEQGKTKGFGGEMGASPQNMNTLIEASPARTSLKGRKLPTHHLQKPQTPPTPI